MDAYFDQGIGLSMDNNPVLETYKKSFVCHTKRFPQAPYKRNTMHPKDSTKEPKQAQNKNDNVGQNVYGSKVESRAESPEQHEKRKESK